MPIILKKTYNMKVKCINNKNCEDHLTVGNIYTVKNDDGLLYLLTSEDNNLPNFIYYKWRFTVVGD